MQCVMRENEARALFLRQSSFDQRQIQVLVAAVKFVTHDGMAKMREVNADLMLATGARLKPQQGKVTFVRANFAMTSNSVCAGVPSGARNL